MRRGTLLLLALAACNPEIVDSTEPTAASVRERLAQPTRLMWTDGSAGTITVQRKVAPDTWETGTAALAIDQGEVVASADPRTGDITIERLSIMLDDIEIPKSVFNREASLSRVRAQLDKPALVTTTWLDDDTAHLSASLDLSFSWALTVEGNTAELGAPDLPPVTLELDVTGDGSYVQADVAANASGELWSWAGLVKLNDLALALRAETL